MPVLYRVVMFLLLATPPIFADLKITTRTTFSGQPPNSQTTYYKGDLMRHDFPTGYQVVDFATGQSFSVDTAKKEYYPFNGRSAPKHVVDPSRKLFVDVAVTDTGEERSWLGHTAHHYLTAKKVRMENEGQPASVYETKSDSWYLDIQVPARVQGNSDQAGSIAVLGGGPAGGEMKFPEVKVTRTGPTPQGFVVWQKTDNYQSEVVELSDSPLDQTLFEPPKTFRKVVRYDFMQLASPRSLSWTDQLALAWYRFRAWLDSL